MVLCGHQAEVVHQLCREVAAAVARHAACICMERCTPPCNSRASYHAGGCSISPACGGFFQRAPCSMLFTVAQPCLWLAQTTCAAKSSCAGRHAASTSLHCWVPPVQEAEAVHRQRQEEVAAAARHAAVEEAARRRAEQERLRQSFAKVGITSSCYAPALHCMLALLGSLCCMSRTRKATTTYCYRWRTVLRAWGDPWQGARRRVLHGRAACSALCVKPFAAGDAAPVQRDHTADQAAAAGVPGAGGAGEGAAGSSGGREASEMGGEHCSQPLLGETLVAVMDMSSQHSAASL